MSQDIERRMWKMLKDRSNNELRRSIRISYYACNKLPTHKKRATDIVKSWDNRGLVNAKQNGARATLTKKGQEKDEVTVTH